MSFTTMMPRSALLFRRLRASPLRHLRSCSSLKVVVPVATASQWRHEAAAAEAAMEAAHPATTKLTTISSSRPSLYKRVRKALRLFARVVKLWLTLSPLALLVPILYLTTSSKSPDDAGALQQLILNDDTDKPPFLLHLYLKLCLRSVEWSGAAVIKLMQWLSSRPDLVGHSFCSTFSALQDNTTPHAWRHTQHALQDSYGENWQDQIRLGELIGSGCIGQVYKGYVKDERGHEKKVAIKVLHPYLDETIKTDLEILRLMAKTLPLIFTPLAWLNPTGAVDEFGRMLQSQLDLRHEADNLIKFNANFKGHKHVVFPQLIEGYEPSKKVLIESYIEGSHVMKWAKSCSHDTELLSSLCVQGIKAVCQMIFLDNCAHGDLHPGNVLITNDNRIGLLDVGIVNEYTNADHALITDVLTAFIRQDGYKAGELMIANSNTRLTGDAARGEEAFCEKMRAINQLALKNGLMEHLGSYISQICEAAARHHVLLNQAFISTALAVKVQEGIVLSLDPTMEIWRVAIPIILEGEAKRTKQKVFEGLKDSASSLWGGEVRS